MPATTRASKKRRLSLSNGLDQGQKPRLNYIDFLPIDLNGVFATFTPPRKRVLILIDEDVFA
jgi:hypothetical protein